MQLQKVLQTPVQPKIMQILSSQDAQLKKQTPLHSAIEKTAYFESSDESILKITKSTSSSCEYRGVRPGTAEIRVKVSKPGFLFVPNNVYLHCDVTVSPKAVSIKFTKKKYRVQPGTKKKLKLTTRPSISKEKATFESSDTEIVEIDTNGRIYAKSIGTVTITAKISNGKTAKCKVIVRNKTAQ